MILNILPCAYWLSIYVPEEVLLQMFGHILFLLSNFKCFLKLDISSLSEDDLLDFCLNMWLVFSFC